MEFMVIVFVFLQVALPRVVTEGIRCPSVCKCDNKTVAICRNSNITSNIFYEQPFERDLKVLDYSGTKLSSLTQVPSWFIPKLQSLNLSDNNFMDLKRLEFDVFKDIQKLDLSMNNISSMDGELFYTSPNLTFLRLDYNQLTEINAITFNTLSLLQHLDLSNNKIASIQPEMFDDITDLQWLSLAENRLIELVPFTFQKQSKLSYLNLSGNFISEISDEAFYGLEKLEYLDLSNNNITNISLFVLQGTVPQMEVNVTVIECISKIKHLKLADNKIEYFNFKELIPLNNSYNISIKLCKLEVLDLNRNCLSGLDDESVNVLRDSTDLIQLSDNPWSCECSDSSDGVYKTLSGNRTLKCETRERTKERSCNNVELSCHTVISTPGAKSHTYPEGEGFDNKIIETSSLGTEVPSDSENQYPGTNSELKLYRANIVIFEIYVILILAAIVVVLIITCAVGKPEWDDCWWEDKLAKRNYY